MEKIKISREQADAIEELKESIVSEVKRFKNNPHLFSAGYDPFLKFDIEDVEKALYNGYEVVPELEVGDWVKSLLGNGLFEIKYIKDGKIYLGDKTGFYWPTDIKKASPEEIATEKTRRWWAEHDRGVWELKEDDLLGCRGGEHVEMVGAVDAEGNPTFYDKKGVNWLNAVKANYRVACFAKDRRDL